MFDANGGNCFGEEWVQLGAEFEPRGACAFVGPTSNTHTLIIIDLIKEFIRNVRRGFG